VTYGIDQPWTEGIARGVLEGCPPGALEAAMRAYRSPGRFYHTWDHILDCLEDFKALSFEHPRAVFLAILFHDAVYIPGHHDNEAKSAQLARLATTQGDGLPDEEVRSIERLILLTAAHQAHGGTLTNDEAKFLDIDLAILGKPWPDYEQYMVRIRKEYVPEIAPPAAYRAGRLAFLEKMAGSRTIFLTAEREAQCGAQARENIAREIEMLRSQQVLAERILTWILRLFR